jgi:hypothetical protein
MFSLILNKMFNQLLKIARGPPQLSRVISNFNWRVEGVHKVLETLTVANLLTNHS